MGSSLGILTGLPRNPRRTLGTSRTTNCRRARIWLAYRWGPTTGLLRQAWPTMRCHARSSDLLCSPAPAFPEWLIYMLVCFLALTFPESPWELSHSLLPGWGPGLSPPGVPDGGLPFVLTNTFPSPNPQNWTNWPLFPWDQNCRGGSQATIPLLFSLASSLWALCPNPFLSWKSRMLPDGLLLQVCLTHSCGCRELIYREGPVAATTPAPDGLHSPPFGGSLPWQRPPGFSFSIPFCG